MFDIIKTLWTERDIVEADTFYRRAYLRDRITNDNDNGEGEDGAEGGDLMGFDMTANLLKGDLGAEDIVQMDYLALLEALGIDSRGRMPNMRSFEKRLGSIPEHWAGTTDPDHLPHHAAYEAWLTTLPEAYRFTPSWLLPTFPRKDVPYPQEVEAIQDTPISISLLRPHPHQVQAIAVLTGRIFLDHELTPEQRKVHEPYQGPPAVSIHADAMGLGKTYQTLGTIAYISHLRSLQREANAPLPAFFGAPRLSPSIFCIQLTSLT